MHPPLAVWSPDYAATSARTCSRPPSTRPCTRRSWPAGHLPGEADLSPPPATRALLELAHDADYLDDLDALRWTPRTQYSELPLTREIVHAFSHGASGTAQTARMALAHGAAAHLGGGLHHAYAGHAEGSAT
jgi:acetoin utilization deacetylase AcuC-like enzyme